jgi:hypothetical protein
MIGKLARNAAKVAINTSTKQTRPQSTPQPHTSDPETPLKISLPIAAAALTILTLGKEAIEEMKK